MRDDGAVDVFAIEKVTIVVLTESSFIALPSLFSSSFGKPLLESKFKTHARPPNTVNLPFYVSILTIAVWILNSLLNIINLDEKRHFFKPSTNLYFYRLQMGFDLTKIELLRKLGLMELLKLFLSHQIVKKKDAETKFVFFDRDFNHLPFTNGHPNSAIPIQRPRLFNETTAFAEQLAENIPHARIVLYEINGKNLFRLAHFLSLGRISSIQPV